GIAKDKVEVEREEEDRAVDDQLHEEKRDVRVGEVPVPEQGDLKGRVLGCTLVHDRERPEGKREQGEARRDETCDPKDVHRTDGKDEREGGTGKEACPEKVELPSLRRPFARREGEKAGCYDRYPDRHQDKKNPAPGKHTGNCHTKRRPQDNTQHCRPREIGKPPSVPGFRDMAGDKRCDNGRSHRCTHCLDDAEKDELVYGARDTAEKRSQGKYRSAEKKHPAVPPYVAEFPEKKEQSREDQQVHDD